MRSSKSRSRSKQNRPRTLGNIINRVFDSSGPEGKVRGTPQQIIEKYQMLARDAHLSNDRVAAENFLQHAEHYTRLLAEAQREMTAEQEARQQFNQQNQSGNGNGNANGNRDRQGAERDFRNDREPRSDEYSDEQPYSNAAASFDVVGEDDTGLVELPEFARPQRRDYAQERPRDDRPRDDRPRDDRPRDDRPRNERAERPRTDQNRPKPAPQDRPSQERSSQDRPAQDRAPQDRPSQERPREDRRPEPRFEQREQRFVETPTPAAAAPAPVVEQPPAPVAEAPKAAPKPRVRKPAVKAEDPKVES